MARIDRLRVVAVRLLVAGALALPFVIGWRSISAAPIHMAPSSRWVVDLAAAQATAEALPLPKPIADRIVRIGLQARDLVYRANSSLAALVHRVGVQLPDLSMLTTEPIASLVSLGASSGFGWRDDPMRHRAKFHSGADVRAKPGTPVVAAGDGVIAFAGYYGGYGNLVAVDHGGGVVTRYAHLRRIHVKKDASVTAGEPIGQVGTTGRTTGPHLHFEVLISESPVDPVMAMTVAELGRSAPLAGVLAAFALAPEMQAGAVSKLDPPKQRPAKLSKQPRPSARPDRPGTVKRVRPVS